MKDILFTIYKLFCIQLPTWINCLRSGLPYDSTWKVEGKPYIIKRKWYEKLFAHHYGGMLTIGKNFSCKNKVNSNSIGLIQPCIFDIAIDGSRIVIGNNVGISGATINASNCVTIEDNVAIGSGCLITDTDSHPIEYSARITDDNSKTKTAPIHIKEGAFIGARCIVMKGVTIGTHSVIGAGSVVTKSIPDNCIACGNPARVVKQLE